MWAALIPLLASMLSSSASKPGPQFKGTTISPQQDTSGATAIGAAGNMAGGWSKLAGGK